jgi:hypothetical protein
MTATHPSVREYFAFPFARHGAPPFLRESERSARLNSGARMLAVLDHTLVQLPRLCSTGLPPHAVKLPRQPAVALKGCQSGTAAIGWRPTKTRDPRKRAVRFRTRSSRAYAYLSTTAIPMTPR